MWNVPSENCRNYMSAAALVNLRWRYTPLLDSLGIERGGLHAFRHTNSTLMDRLGVPLKVRQQRLGHSDPALTLGVYTHVASEDDERVAEQLDGILRPNAPKSENEGKTEVAKSLYLN